MPTVLFFSVCFFVTLLATNLLPQILFAFFTSSNWDFVVIFYDEFLSRHCHNNHRKIEIDKTSASWFKSSQITNTQCKDYKIISFTNESRSLSHTQQLKVVLFYFNFALFKKIHRLALINDAFVCLQDFVLFFTSARRVREHNWKKTVQIFVLRFENVTEPKTAYELTKWNIISLVECSLSYNGGVRYECTIVYIMRSIMNLFMFFYFSYSQMVYAVPFFVLLFHFCRCRRCCSFHWIVYEALARTHNRQCKMKRDERLSAQNSPKHAREEEEIHTIRLCRNTRTNTRLACCCLKKTRKKKWSIRNQAIIILLEANTYEGKGARKTNDLSHSPLKL